MWAAVVGCRLELVIEETDIVDQHLLPGPVRKRKDHAAEREAAVMPSRSLLVELDGTAIGIAQPLPRNPSS